MSFSKKEREEYNKRREHIGKEYGINKNEYNRLRRTAHALSDADTNYANGTQGNRNHYSEPKYHGNKILNEYTEKHHKKDTNAAFSKSQALLKKKGIHAFHQTDPRGASLYIGKKRIHRDRYPSEGHHIY